MKYTVECSKDPNGERDIYIWRGRKFLFVIREAKISDKEILGMLGIRVVCRKISNGIMVLECESKDE